MSHRVIAITGAASGIGRAFAIRFAQDGNTDLALLDRNVKDLEVLAAQLETMGARTLSIRCDVTDHSACRQAVRKIERTFGRLDVLMNNAGITQISAFAATAPEVYQSVMDVNFMGAINCTQAALHLLEQSRGLIAVTSSIAGLAPLPGRTGYCASKFALHGCFETLRIELRDAGVGVLMICPGFTKTNLSDVAQNRKDADRPTVGNLEAPEAVAEAVYHAVRKRKRRLVLTPAGRFAALLYRLAPRLYDRVIYRNMRGRIQAENRPATT